MYYIVDKVHGSLHRKDWEKVTEDIQTGGYLLELNKGYSIGMGIYLDGIGLGRQLEGESAKERADKAKALQTKVIQLTKVNMLAGYAVASTPSPVNIEKATLLEYLGMPQSAVISINVNNFLTYIKTAARQSRFFSVTNSFGPEEDRIILPDGRTLLQAEEGLFEHIVKVRRLGAKPSALVDGSVGGYKWFTDEEVEEMNRVGLYAPFKA